MFMWWCWWDIGCFMLIFRSCCCRVPENDDVILISWQLSHLQMRRFREEEDARNRTSAVWYRLRAQAIHCEILECRFTVPGKGFWAEQYETPNKFSLLNMKLEPELKSWNWKQKGFITVSIGVQDTVEVYWAFLGSAHAFSGQRTGFSVFCI